MKKSMLWIAVAAFSTGVLQAQDFSGSWQGTLSAGGRDLRIVLKVSKADTGLKGLFYSIDQPGPGIPTGAITAQGLSQQQLGLKLESTKTPVDVIVIDHLEKPSAN